jgi:hypothetical protein
MTARKKAGTRTTSARRLALGKRTLKDLSAPRGGPKAGFIMKDTIIVRTSGR